MSDELLKTGKTQTQETTAKKSTANSKPSERSSEKSSGSQPQMNHRRQPKDLHKPQTEADKVRAVQEMFRGERSSERDDDRDTGVTDAASVEDGKPFSSSANGDPDSGLLGLDRDGEDPSGVGNSDETGRDLNRLSVKELAERLGTTPKKLYESLELVTGDGESLTLGEAKDRLKSQEAATREIVERENSLTERETATLANMQVLQQVMDDLRDKLSPQTLDALQKKVRTQEARERRLLHSAMPELSDPNKLDAFRNDVAEYMGQFGFRPNELVIRDHRIALAIKKAVETQRQLDRLMSFDPEKDQKPPKTQKPQGNGRRRRATSLDQTIEQARQGTDADKTRAVGALLRSKGRKR